MLDLRQLRYFVMVAELEHVARAAEQLHISQSPLSRQIVQLEAQLGLTLFERTKQRLKLTPEGRDFLQEARGLLARAEQLERHGQRLGAGDIGSLSIGYVEGAVHAGLIAATLRRFRQGRSDLQLRLRSQRSGQQIEALRQRDLDIGFLYTPPETIDDDVASELILVEPLVLALPSSDPLAGAAAIKPADLDGRTWITVVRQPQDTNRDPFLMACAQAGFLPNIAYETADPLTSLGLVSAGLGLATIQASLRRNTQPDIVFRDLPWFHRSVAIHLAWRRADRRKIIHAFRQAVQQDGE